jgi:hypothetical protein
VCDKCCLPNNELPTDDTCNQCVAYWGGQGVTSCDVSWDCVFLNPEFQCKRARGGSGSFNSSAACASSCKAPTPCTGNSSGLDPDQCSDYQDFFDGAGGTGWGDCNNSRLDPCSCGGSTCNPAPPAYDDPCIVCKDGDITAL